MEINYMSKLVWLVETIRREKRITFQELSLQWKKNEELSGGLELHKRTFHKWRPVIYETFNIDIRCESGGDYAYYIANEQDMKNGSLEKWLLSTYSITNSLQESKKIRHRILLEDIPSGQQYLEPIMAAMKNDRMIHITYRSYWHEGGKRHYIMPLCVKLFRQRWHLVGRVWSTGETLVYCLDRICDFRLSSHTFEYPADFSPQDFFYGCMGVIAGTDTPVETVKLKVSNDQAHYWRDLPVPASQQHEVGHGAGHTVFELRIRPTLDFQQEILWNGDDVEVLEPLWLRKEIAEKAKRMWEQYCPAKKGKNKPPMRKE